MGLPCDRRVGTFSSEVAPNFSRQRVEANDRRDRQCRRVPYGELGDRLLEKNITTTRAWTPSVLCFGAVIIIRRHVAGGFGCEWEASCALSVKARHGGGVAGFGVQVRGEAGWGGMAGSTALASRCWAP